MSRPPSKTSIDNHAMSIWSKVVRLRDNQECQRCKYLFLQGEVKTVKPASEAHHIFGRAIKATRYLPDNGIALCAHCHKFDKFGFEQSGSSPTNIAIVKAKLGEERWQELEQQAKMYTKDNIDFRAEQLEVLRKYLSEILNGKRNIGNSRAL